MISHLELEEIMNFVDDLDTEEIISIPGVLPLIAKYYRDVSVVEETYRPLYNPPGVVKTKQDEKDWNKAKMYFAEGSSIPERRWSSREWATVMTIYKNIKAKRKRGRR